MNTKNIWPYVFSTALLACSLLMTACGRKDTVTHENITQAPRPVDDGVVFRNRISLEQSFLAQKAENAIQRILSAGDCDEDIGVRRYYTGDIDQDGKYDLLLVTCITSAIGNHWSHDFILIRSSKPNKPIFKNFGGKGIRSYKDIYMNYGRINVTFLYYAPTDADCCPSIEKKGYFVLKGDELVEIKEEDTPVTFQFK